MAQAGGGYGVKLVRGPFLRLPPSPQDATDRDSLIGLVRSLRNTEPGVRLAADLFSGAGGLSLGLQDAGFQVVLSVDHDADAVETHRHHFRGLSVDWDLSRADNVERVAGLVRDCGVDLLAGGPPCQPFSKAGRSKIRHRVRAGLRDPHDSRRDLWRAFLEVVRLSLPPAVLMENVPDMALDKEMFIFRSIVEELEQLGYAVSTRLVETWRYGVPQFRQRLIVVAMRDGASFEWPAEAADRVSVWNAIGDLPEVEGGWRPEGGGEGWTDYAGPQTAFQRRMRDGVATAARERVYDHITRPVREDDERAFEHMDSTTRYSDLPEDVRRYRADIFDDKYKRLAEDDLSRTITAHIAKDGYWYIHPRQSRTITVREAARLQTFPDRYRFAGPPSSAFRQIGNAVPPAVGSHLGSALMLALDEAVPAEGLQSRQVAGMLSSWLDTHPPQTLPWLRAGSRWQVLAADSLFDRAAPGAVSQLWPLVAEWLDEPATTVAHDEQLREVAGWIGRADRVTRLLETADWLLGHPGALGEADESVGHVPMLTEALADFLTLVVPDQADGGTEPVLAARGVLRVAGRFLGEPVDRRNRLSEGRLAVARLIGGDATARAAHLALVEIAAGICRPADMLCGQCPLAAAGCRSQQAPEAGQPF